MAGRDRRRRDAPACLADSQGPRLCRRGARVAPITTSRCARPPRRRLAQAATRQDAAVGNLADRRHQHVQVPRRSRCWNHRRARARWRHRPLGQHAAGGGPRHAHDGTRHGAGKHQRLSRRARGCLHVQASDTTTTPGIGSRACSRAENGRTLSVIDQHRATAARRASSGAAHRQVADADDGRASRRRRSGLRSTARRRQRATPHRDAQAMGSERHDVGRRADGISVSSAASSCLGPRLASTSARAAGRAGPGEPGREQLDAGALQLRLVIEANSRAAATNASRSRGSCPCADRTRWACQTPPARARCARGRTRLPPTKTTVPS